MDRTATARVSHMADEALREQMRLCEEEADLAYEAGDREFASGARTMAQACAQVLARRHAREPVAA
jgi:hypothetical protein